MMESIQRAIGVVVGAPFFIVSIAYMFSVYRMLKATYEQPATAMQPDPQVKPVPGESAKSTAMNAATSATPATTTATTPPTISSSGSQPIPGAT